MKKITYFTKLFIITFLCINFASCSSEEDSSNLQESPEDNLPEEAKTFLGYWKNQGNKGGDFIFFEDGTCWMMPFTNSSSHNYSHNDGYWTYDPSTKILATTTNQWQ